MLTSAKPARYLLIKLLQFQPSAPSPNNPQIYFSFTLASKLYFSSIMPSSPQALTDDLILPLAPGLVPQPLQSLQLNRWQNHMIMFTHELELSQLRTRNSIVKRVETKNGEILKLMVVGLMGEELGIGGRFVREITQHYLFVQGMEVRGAGGDRGKGKGKGEKEEDQGPSFFRISTENNSYVMPVMDGQILIKLPQTLKFSHIKNNKQITSSTLYQSSQLPPQIPLSPRNNSKHPQSLTLHLQYAINLQQPRPENTLLLDSQQLMLYDLEFKFDNPDALANCKVKLVYGNKGFQLGGQLMGSGKGGKVRRICNFVVKSEEEECVVLVERNLKIVGIGRFGVQELVPFVVNSVKKKLNDLTGKPIGTIKFKCQKAKNLSTPSNNKQWRQTLKSKNLTNQFLLIFDQLSINYQKDTRVSLSLKTESEEKITDRVPNLRFFGRDREVVRMGLGLGLMIKGDESVYMIVRDEEDGQEQGDKADFIGIALFNASQVRFGLSCAQIKFFKNQTHTLTLNCTVNKLSSYPFIKPSFQPQLLQSLSHRSLSLSITMREVHFSPFFYTYRYDNKNQVYCIVQVNRVKKVLIMENRNKGDELAFGCSASSDNLDFSVQEAEVVRVRVTFLVSDVGQDQEIYGSAVVKIKASQLESASSSLKFYLVEIKNDFGSNLGQINMEVHKASLFNSHVKQSRDILESGTKVVESQKRKVKMHLAQISQSVQLKEKSFQSKNQAMHPKSPALGVSSDEVGLSKKPSARYQKVSPFQLGTQRRKRNHSVIGIEGSLKLPAIREQSASPQNKKNYNELVQMMKIRKRSMKGHYEQNSMLESYQMRSYNNKALIHMKPTSHNEDPSAQTFHLKQKIQKENPNISRNMEILFPKKSARSQKVGYLKRPIKYEEEKLKGLKSVMNQIVSDMGEIQPTVKDQERYQKESKNSERPKYGSHGEIDHTKGPEWDDNQFAM